MMMQLSIATNYNLIRTKSGWIISTKEKMWPKLRGIEWSEDRGAPSTGGGTTSDDSSKNEHQQTNLELARN